MRYHALDAWRGVFALVIALARLDVDSALWRLPVVQLSYPLVDFFFVLSGFVIAHAYLDRLDGSARSGAGFMIRRFGRMWPLHLFTFALLVAIEGSKLAMIAAGVASATVPFTGEQSPSTVLSSLALLQAMGLHDHAVWNTPAWSISVEFWTCLVFLAIVTFARSRLVVISAGLVGVALAILAMRAPHGMESTFDYGFWRCIAGFFAGYLVWRAHRAALPMLSSVAVPWTAVEALTVVAILGWLVVSHRTPAAYATPVVMGLAVFVFAAERGAISRALSGRVGAALGAWSFSIYLLCPLVAYVAERSATLLGRVLGQSLWIELGDRRLITLGSEWANGAVVLVYLALVVAVSAATYRLVEVPARRWFYRRAERVERGSARARVVPAE
jgi:peptidoglycan/LPS O-acetylase OafA/YrhL